jgi:hypothetical protein
MSSHRAEFAIGSRPRRPQKKSPPIFLSGLHLEFRAISRGRERVPRPRLAFDLPEKSEKLDISNVLTPTPSVALMMSRYHDCLLSLSRLSCSRYTYPAS